MTIIIKLICSFFISFFCLSSFALGAVSPGKIELPAMPESSNGSKKGQLKNLGLSYSLMDLQTGKLVDSKFPSKPRSLASVSKLLTFYFVPGL